MQMIKMYCLLNKSIDLGTYASFNLMLLGDKPLMSGLYWQAAKDYKWRVLRLSILITILVILIVSTLPSNYQGMVRLEFSSFKTEVLSAEDHFFVENLDQQALHSQYQKMLAENIAKSVLNKLKKFSLIELNSDVENAISTYAFIERIKQKIRTTFAFMPQQEPNPLSPKQLGMLKNNFTLEQIIQSLQLRYLPSQSAVYVDYKDQSATFSIIIAKLAADSYMQSVSETKLQMFEHVLDQIKQISTQSYALSNASNTTKVFYHKFQIPYLERTIEFTSQDIKKLKRLVRHSNQRRQDMNFMGEQMRKNGLNVSLLLRHKQVAEHPLIQPFKRNVEIAKVKLNDLSLLPERVISQVVVAKEELLLLEKTLTGELVLFASNIELYYSDAGHELNKYRAQLTSHQQKLKTLTLFQKQLNQFPPSADNHQTRQLQEKLNQITRFAHKQSTAIEPLVGHFTTMLLTPNKAVIASLSFILSILVISLLVLILVNLKATADRKTARRRSKKVVN
jgi:uncharacterized protein involved in exopolysaccharide biosynthesis